ncbi:glycosyltransferase family 4 protein [Priestia megaterium]|uniref:glycosyltransferase family 4 protein n=1 Tax=Priestia megaterium TaxID=1404 RepID=UPI00345AD424
MRVLHLPYGSPMIDLCHSLRLKGVDATSCHFYTNRYNFKPDICLNFDAVQIQFREKKIRNYMKEVINKYDIFHFHFGETFLPDKSDLEFLKNHGKKMVVHHHGSEVRSLTMARKFNPYVLVKPEWTDIKIQENLKILSRYIDHAIVQDYELKSYIKDHYRTTHVIPNSINIEEFQPNYPKPKRFPLIVHAPTLRNLKGTEFVLKAVNQLKREGVPINFQLIEGLSHQETKQLLSKADIVIDQLRIGACGYITVESMALGKPVICYVREDLLKQYPKEFPVINANPDTITDVLREVIKKPEKWTQIGKRGRFYVNKFHNINKNINQYIEIYSNL